MQKIWRCVCMSSRFLSHEEIQASLLSVLSRYSAYCSHHNLKYSLVGGTLLGAIRHQGFIPWDDDIDIGMPRPDYERLIAQKDTFEQETGYVISGFRKLPLRDTPMLKIEDPNIHAREAHSYPTHLWIDILPVDGLPQNSTLSDLHCQSASILRRTLAVLTTPRTPQSSSFTGFMKDSVIGPLTRLFPQLPKVAGRSLNALASRIDYASTPFVGILGWGMYGKNERVPLEGWENLTTVVFENKEFTAISCWNTYLKNLYGDYMSLPDEDERKTHGLTVWVDEGE